MNAENKIALALINLTTGGFHLKDVRLYHDDLGELPSVKEIAAVVEENPEKIAYMLLDDAVNESLPVELDTPTVRRITAGAGTVFDVERLTMARAEASRKVFCIGQKLMDEAGEPKKTTPPARRKSEAEGALEVILRLVEEGKEVFGEEPFNMTFPDYSMITKAISDYASELAYLLANELHIRSRLLGVDDTLLDRINEKSSTREDVHWLINEMENSVNPYKRIEQAAQLLIQLSEAGYAYKGKSIVNIADKHESLPEVDFSLIDYAIKYNPCALADLLADELEDVPDEIVETIEQGNALEDEVYALCELLTLKKVSA